MDSATQLRPGPAVPEVPAPVVSRLPAYLHALEELVAEGRTTVSSEELAGKCQVGAAILRRDLSQVSAVGRRGVGYDSTALTRAIRGFLDVDSRRAVAIVGVGRLGTALAHYPGFLPAGFEIAAVFDDDPAKIGTAMGGLTVRHPDDLAAVIARTGIDLAVLAVPAEAAQATADACAAAGVRGLLNFAPVLVSSPEHVHVRSIDLASEMQLLGFYAPAAAPDPTSTEPASAEPAGAAPAAPAPGPAPRDGAPDAPSAAPAPSGTAPHRHPDPGSQEMTP
ncbi:redox-sensing transcriptional repressor Rex [Brevibacterium sp. BRM-1]|uniref:redox-sensing transcriptional repressor Rex n=1 Tax=Brevibacterium sp. BRM-1 TaxID=2999062 RepID=UPI00228320E4|nr:redox-sensing transcriptional repressor Rex [Brevibacterium sp. BRM-1]WAL39065.1 redox-sensing transcriptional repressor Rex [Brevibacterium sp. BRM-1]